MTQPKPEAPALALRPIQHADAPPLPDEVRELTLADWLEAVRQAENRHHVTYQHRGYT